MTLSGINSRIFSARHMGEDLPFDMKALFTRAIIYLGRRLYRNDRTGWGAYALAPRETALDIDGTIDLIASKIANPDEAGFMAGKIGTGDGESLLRFIDKYAPESVPVKWWKILTGRRGPFWWDNSIRAGLCVCAGVFPITDESIEEFCRIFMSYCSGFDGFARCTYGERRLYDLLCPTAVPISMDGLVPLKHPRTWYGALAGKKVLVVHQYAKTIRTQYEKHVEFHKGQGPLPRFKLITYRPVNSAGGRNAQFDRWKTALDHMIEDISQIDFDVALLGCAVYGVPLSVHIKRMGRIAIYTGGATQVVFGIKGGRWDNDGIYNEHWTRPFPDDIPENMEIIEHGSFV